MTYRHSGVMNPVSVHYGIRLRGMEHVTTPKVEKLCEGKGILERCGILAVRRLKVEWRWEENGRIERGYKKPGVVLGQVLAELWIVESELTWDPSTPDMPCLILVEVDRSDMLRTIEEILTIVPQLLTCTTSCLPTLRITRIRT